MFDIHFYMVTLGKFSNNYKTGLKYTSFKNAFDKIEQLSKEILLNPELEKFNDKYGNFLKTILDRKNQIKSDIENAELKGKPIEIAVAGEFLNKMKNEQSLIKIDYDAMEKIILSGEKSTNPFVRTEDYLVVEHKTKAKDCKDSIDKLSTNKEFKEELNFIKKEAGKVYKEISSAVKECYITLKEVEKQADNHIIRNNVYKQATSEIDEDLIME